MNPFRTLSESFIISRLQAQAVGRELIHFSISPRSQPFVFGPNIRLGSSSPFFSQRHSVGRETPISSANSLGRTISEWGLGMLISSSVIRRKPWWLAEIQISGKQHGFLGEAPTDNSSNYRSVQNRNKSCIFTSNTTKGPTRIYIRDRRLIKAKIQPLQKRRQTPAQASMKESEIRLTEIP